MSCSTPEAVEARGSNSESKCTQRGANSLTVFVRVPGEKSRTLTLRLTGRETMQDVVSLAQRQTKTVCITGLTVRGRDCSSVAQLRPNDTLIPRAAQLPGGTYVTIVCEGVEPIAIDDKNVTIGECIDRFQEQYGSTKKQQYTFSYSINDEELELPEDEDPESDDWLKWKAQDLSVFGFEAGGELKVVRTAVEGGGDDKKGSSSGPSDVQFLKNIPYFTQTACEKFRKLLSPDQKKLMESFQKREMDGQGLNLILTTMTNDQIDNLLLVFQAKQDYKNQILKYLLVKANQWTELSETMNKQASDSTKTLQIRRLVNQLKNTFNPDDENDSIITELFQKEQSTMLDQIISNLTPQQRIELLMQILTDKQRTQVIDCIRPVDVKEFWPLMTKERRMEIFGAFDMSKRIQFLLNDEMLSSDLKIRLWDNIGKSMRLAIWDKTSDEIFVRNELREFISNNPEKWADLKNQESLTDKLQHMLLSSITVSQQSRLWSNLEGDQKQDVLDHIMENESMSVEFWKSLNHEKRCELIDELKENQVVILFTMLKDLELRASLFMMLKQEYKQKCAQAISPDQQEELFLFGHFEQLENSGKTSKEFIDDLVKDYYNQNNQVVPFDKIEGGYVQCISNPQVVNGFITVQIVQPRYKVDNKVIHINTDFNERELETDEARMMGASKDEHNDQFRFTQNLYGQLQEHEPNPARNSKELGVISFFEYSQALGLQCTHSFFAQNPVKFKRNGKCASELILFTSNDGDVFFFNKKSTGASSNESVEDGNFDLCLQILNHHQNSERGELSRESSESCTTYRIDQSSRLFDFLMKGRFVMKKYTEIYHLNSVPSMVNSDIDKLIVFSHCKQGDQGPALYFYDVNMCKEIIRVKGGEAFIDYYEHSSLPERTGRLMILGNKEIMGDSIWNENQQIEKSYAEKYDACVDPERKSAIVISLLVNLHDHHGGELVDLLGEGSSVLLPDMPVPSSKDAAEKSKIVSNADMGAWMPQVKGGIVEQVIVIDMRDEDKNFSQRYLRQTPTQIFPHDRDPDNGKLKSFTLLFYDLYAYTFSYLRTDGTMTESKRIETQKLVDEVNKKIHELQAEGDKRGDLAQNIAAKEEEKRKLWEDATPKLYFYKCKYKVPEASFVLIDRRDPKSHKAYIQVSNRNERAQQKAQDSLRDVNQFDIQLFNISDTRIKPDAVERAPNESETRKLKVPMSRDALETYAKNLYANKFGECYIKALATPVLFHQQAWAGGFLYEMREEQMTVPMLDWYVAPISGQGAQASIVRPAQQSVQVDYPYMVYKGFVPDNRELILVNLADKSSPQKIIHLYDMQFLCFVGHNFSDREAKIGMLCMEGNNEVRLCWLVCRQPYKKRQIQELDHLMIHKVPIVFNVPIMNQIGDIVRAEFVPSPGFSTIEESIFGALLIQTKNEIYISSNASGKYDRITGGLMRPLTLQRGFNSVFYYTQAIGETDSIVQELKVSLVSGEWNFQLLEIHKVSEGRIIALEMDPENYGNADSAYNYDNQLIEQLPDVLNIIYIMDDKENMWKIRQKSEEESGARYEVIKESNLSMGKELTIELNEFKQKDFNRIAITERCITVNNKNFNFFNSHIWTLDISKKRSSDSEPAETANLDYSQQFSKVVGLQSMSWTSRQLIECVYQNCVDGKWQETHAFITKLQPGSRRQDLVGLRGLRDMESVNMISNNNYLMKFKGSDKSGTLDYWSVIDKYGQVLDLPDKAKEIFIWSNFSSGQSRQKSAGVTVILRGGQRRVISFDADVTYVERKMTKIEFNRDGEIMSIKEFQKKMYDDGMRQCILEDLMDSSIKLQGEKSKITRESAQNIVDTLEYSDDVLCTKKGDLYRIASIVDPRFDDDIAVNPLNDDDGNLKVVDDKLSMGVYIVNSKSQRGVGNQADTKLETDDKELKIILFLCKSEGDRNQLSSAGFVIIGRFLCWSYPSEKVVHTLDMTGLNATGVEEATKTVSRAMTSLMSGLGLDLSQTRLANPDEGRGRQSLISTASQRNSSVDQALPRTNTSSKLKTAAIASRVATSRSSSKAKKSAFAINDSIVSTESLPINSDQNDDDFQPVRQSSSIQMPIPENLAIKSMLQQQSALYKPPSLVNKVSQRIKWASYTTNPIDLRVMCESDQDKQCMLLAEVPKNLRFSLAQKEIKEDKSKSYQHQQGLIDNLLQVTVKDRTIIYDLEPKHQASGNSDTANSKKRQPQELFLLNASSQFIAIDKYVEVGVKVFRCRENPLYEGYLVEQVLTNRCKDICLYRQDRLLFSDKLVDEETKKKRREQPRPPISKGIFKKFAEVDLQELVRIQDKVSRQARLDNIDFQSILSQFQGHTAFSVFANEVKFHEQVLIQIQEGDWLEEEQEDETILENNELRRLFRILTMPTPDIVDKATQDQQQQNESEMQPGQQLQRQTTEEQKFAPSASFVDDQNEFSKISAQQASFVEAQGEDQQEQQNDTEVKEGLVSVLQKSLYTKSSRIKDCLLQIANRCADCSITSFCANQNDFSRLLRNLTQQAIELISDSFISTPFTQMIVNVPWGPEVPLITFRRPNTLLTQQDCEEQISKALRNQFGVSKNEETKAQVDVRLLDLSWLLSDRKNFIHFVSTLEEASNDQIYNTELISTLLDNFWEENFRKILFKCLLPWVGYAFCVMWFFVQSLKDDHSEFLTRILGLVSLVGLVYQVSIEYRQNLGADSPLEYFTSIVNIIDMFQVTTSFWIIIMGILGIEFPSYEAQRVIAALATLCLWIKVLDWCKLFGPTSFFVRLIVETIIDIKYFMIIFIVALMMFGMPLYILQLNRGMDNAIVADTFGGLWFFNAFYNQYMLALGEFNIDAYQDGPQTYLCYLFFLSATFMTQITFLNMLIALMGDTFAKVMEQKEQFGLQTKLQIMSDYTALVLDENQTQDPNCYMFVVSQRTEGTDDPNAAWEGNLSVIKKVIEKGLANLQKNMDRKLNAVHAQNMESKTRDLMNDKDSRGQYLRIMEKFAAVDNRFNAIDVEKTDKIYDIVRKSQQESRVGIRELNESIRSEQAEMQARNQSDIAELAHYSRSTNKNFQEQLESLKEAQLSLVHGQNELKMIIETGGNHSQAQHSSEESDRRTQEMSTQIVEAKQAISEAAQTSNDAIQKLAERQEQMLQQIDAIESRNAQFNESLSQQLTSLASANQGDNSAQILASIQSFMEQVTAQQQQMQQEIAERQENDKQEILRMLQSQGSDAPAE